MNLNKWFDKGLTKDQYIDSLDRHRENFLHIYDQFEVPNEDNALLKEKEDIRVIVLAEEWCGHCMLNIPILLRLTERANISVRFLPRDENLELMDQYLTNEKRIIPIFIFIDQDGNELAKWGPMAPEVATYVEQLKKEYTLPAKDDPKYEEVFTALIKEISKTFSTDKAYWDYVYQDIKSKL